MSLTVSEVFENSKYNISSNIPFQVNIGENQLLNYITAKELGADNDDDWDDWEDKVYNHLNNKTKEK